MRFYDKETGDVIHEVPCTTKGSEGKMRRPRVTDARKDSRFVVSVTSIFDVAAAPGLGRWQVGRCFQYVWENKVKVARMIATQPLADFIQSMRNLLEDYNAHYAEFGNMIHDAVEDYIRYGKMPVGDALPYLEKLAPWYVTNFEEWISMEFVCIGEGYAGRCDYLGVMREGGPLHKAAGSPEKREVIVDWKTRVPDKTGKYNGYKKEPAQMCAYRLTLPEYFHDAALVNVYINRDTPQTPVAKVWKDHDKHDRWFTACFNFFCQDRDYFPLKRGQSSSDYIDECVELFNSRFHTQRTSDDADCWGDMRKIGLTEKQAVDAIIYMGVKSGEIDKEDFKDHD